MLTNLPQKEFDTSPFMPSWLGQHLWAHRARLQWWTGASLLYQLLEGQWEGDEWWWDLVSDQFRFEPVIQASEASQRKSSWSALGLTVYQPLHDSWLVERTAHVPTGSSATVPGQVSLSMRAPSSASPMEQPYKTVLSKCRLSQLPVTLFGPCTSLTLSHPSGQAFGCS